MLMGYCSQQKHRAPPTKVRCLTLLQLWRLDEAESMLKRAIKARPGYVSAITSLGVTLQASGKVRYQGRFAHLNA